MTSSDWLRPVSGDAPGSRQPQTPRPDPFGSFFRRDANTRERLGVASDKPVQTRDQSQRIAPVGLHLLAVLVPVARTHDDVLDAEPQQTPVQPEAKGTGFVATMHDVGLLRLLGRPRDKGLG